MRAQSHFDQAVCRFLNIDTTLGHMRQSFQNVANNIATHAANGDLAQLANDLKTIDDIENNSPYAKTFSHWSGFQKMMQEFGHIKDTINNMRVQIDGYGDMDAHASGTCSFADYQREGCNAPLSNCEFRCSGTFGIPFSQDYGDGTRLSDIDNAYFSGYFSNEQASWGNNGDAVEALHSYVSHLFL